ncbi:chloramphenicol acetyltransferase [Mucilaginibacter myungsuensis]|uniref:Chloramphenicol acetyltransferase n=1 Tax=Mucilaginibacter myungsuensis TaxID=649104 RepID=A0A929L1D6_9SPHI|nr:chloramphenicol acetyltransferase [Mucilaginibacter myungsuensis]MBE9663818.1 chloramphenicol acetyltransferase [Mucilaginibacter myungsuensis]MDN3598467.1 chloramphenicol acetyltransferase [Mucilaginibacter myungsuensis]
MNQKLDIENWNRKEHFLFFKTFDEPYYGVTVDVDMTRAYARAKELGVSFYIYYLHKTLQVMNELDNFRYRIVGDEVEICDRVDMSATVLRDDHTFGFSHFIYHPDLREFCAGVTAEIARVKSLPGLFTVPPLQNVIHFSALPWIKYTHISQATKQAHGDTCPKVSVGKLTEVDGRKLMPYNLHVHHGLVDGYHLGQFFELFQGVLDE